MTTTPNVPGWADIDRVFTFLGEDANELLAEGGDRGRFDEIVDAFNAEIFAQKAVCRIYDYNEDLTAALYRRVARHLELKNLPLGVQATADGAVIGVGRLDGEIRRLEAPYRKVMCG